VQRLLQVHLNDEKDMFVWGLTSSGIFSIKLMYLDLLDDDTKYLKKYIWKMKVPLKIKIFMWFLHRKVILTKDNLIKRNWNGNDSCCFCVNDESIQHLFFECPLAKLIWRIIHMTFGLEPPKNTAHLFGNWLKGIPKKDLIQIRVGILFGQFGIQGITLSLTSQKNTLLCRLSVWLPTGSVCGLISSKRSSGRRWILGATVWRW
jgi:hypothetical protein